MQTMSVHTYMHDCAVLYVSVCVCMCVCHSPGCISSPSNAPVPLRFTTVPGGTAISNGGVTGFFISLQDDTMQPQCAVTPQLFSNATFTCTLHGPKGTLPLSVTVHMCVAGALSTLRACVRLCVCACHTCMCDSPPGRVPCVLCLCLCVSAVLHTHSLVILRSTAAQCRVGIRPLRRCVLFTCV